MTRGQTTGQLDSVLGAYYDKRFIEWERHMLRMKQFAQERPLPGNIGKTVYFTGYRPLPLVTSALTEGSSPTNSSYEARQINATIAEWGWTVKMTKLLELTKLDSGIEEQVRLSSDQAARSLDYQMTKEVVRNGIWGLVPAMTATNYVKGTVVSTASNSTSVFCLDTHVDSAFSDLWMGAVVTLVKDRPLNTAQVGTDQTIKYGWSGRTTAYVSKGTTHGGAGRDKWTVTAAAPEAFQSGDEIRIVSQNSLDTTSVLSTSPIAMAQRDLVNNRAMPYANGYFGAVVSPFPSMDFKRDATWTDAGTYSNVDQLWRGEIGRWFGFRFVETTLPGREDTDGTENVTSGAVYHNLFFGQNSFGHTKLQGANQRLIYVVQGEDKSDALDMYSIVGWKQVFANKALTAPHAVSVMTGATA